MSRPQLRFAHLDQLALACVFERLVPGQLHADGRRYLPQVMLRLAPMSGTITHLEVVDRHHLVDPASQGHAGLAQLLFLLSRIRLQHGAPQQGLFDRHSARSYAPLAFGRIVQVGAWELQRGQLPYETLYTELVLDVGVGTIGVRTSATAPDIAAQIGKETLETGDWIVVERSRIDILGFQSHDA